MTNYLAVDTASRHLTVLAQKGEKRVLRRREDCALRHSVLLMDEVDAAMTEAGLTPAECDCFCAVTGPGSFTGIRIGVSAVKGFALATGKPLVAVTSFDLVSYNVKEDGKYLVAVDAAHGHYYACGYLGAGVQFLPPCYLSEEELIAYGLPVYGFEGLSLPNYTQLNAADCLPAAVAACAAHPSKDIGALYVRKSQAEEGRK